MTAYVLDWLSLLGRWLHLVAGIAWIGSSFYFIWLDNHLLPPADPVLAKSGVAGELWAVHGGGFYQALKYRVAPATLPRSLHWFYWEAYTTFLSGLFLLGLLYYGQAELYLIDRSVAALSKPAAIAIGAAFLAGGWIVYDGLCRSPLGRDSRALGAVLAVLLSTAAWGLCRLFSGRVLTIAEADGTPTAGMGPFGPSSHINCCSWLCPCSSNSAPCSARSWWRMCFSSSFRLSERWCARKKRIASPIFGAPSPPSCDRRTTPISRCRCCS